MDEASCARCGRRGVLAADDVTALVGPDGSDRPLLSASRHGDGATCDPCEAARTEEAEARAGRPAARTWRRRRRRRQRV